MNPKRIEILGVPVDCVTMDGVLEMVDAMVHGSTAHVIVAMNPEKVIKARRDPDLLRRLQRTSLLIPDGIGVVLAARLLGLGRMGRVPGSELMPAICERAARKGYRIFLCGASPEVNRRTVEVLRHRYPGIHIVGHQHGYLGEAEMPALIERINASRADVLFVALGSPKQERWMDTYAPRLTVKVCQGVGGTFDVISGRVRRAPLFLRKLSLEWLYRLATQPGRLLRQTALPAFVFGVFQALVSSAIRRRRRVRGVGGTSAQLPR
jgi:N-acetylglucosaminyldiphosphoundecaprenol N-acetyl-beta-D-mannosaminyltransferase